ncbi:hypothetical protein AGIG_G2052 [Arapaima gigas]
MENEILVPTIIIIICTPALAEPSMCEKIQAGSPRTRRGASSIPGRRYRPTESLTTSPVLRTTHDAQTPADSLLSVGLSPRQQPGTPSRTHSLPRTILTGRTFGVPLQCYAGCARRDPTHTPTIPSAPPRTPKKESYYYKAT